MDRFQGISCLISKELLLVENINFSSQMLYRSVSNEQISRDFLQQISKESFYRLVYLHEILSIFIKSQDFNEIKEMNRF